MSTLEPPQGWGTNLLMISWNMLVETLEPVDLCYGYILVAIEPMYGFKKLPSGVLIVPQCAISTYTVQESSALIFMPRIRILPPGIVRTLKKSTLIWLQFVSIYSLLCTCANVPKEQPGHCQDEAVNS